MRFIKGGEAHATLEQAIAGLPENLRGLKPDGMPFSIWQLLDHIRIAQWDILQYSIDQNHLSPNWPDDYWSKDLAPANQDAWHNCIAQIENDKAEFMELIEKHKADLLKSFSTENSHTLFREALLIADHEAYHAGQIVLIRKMLSAWPN